MKGGPEQGRNRNNGGKGQRKDVRDKRLKIMEMEDRCVKTLRYKETPFYRKLVLSDDSSFCIHVFFFHFHLAVAVLMKKYETIIWTMFVFNHLWRLK